MICLLAATAHETRQLRRQLPFQVDPLISGQAFSCQFLGEQLLLLHVGIGSISAGICLTRLLEQLTPELLILFGCGGSYPGAGLKNGDLALATSEYFGDLGTASEQGFIPLDELGIPVSETEPAPFVQQLELESRWRQAVGELLGRAAELQTLRLVEGPFVTVNTVSGTAALSRDLERRTGGVCENMEGAALAQCAALYRLPLIEVRGISNPCGTRERALWDLKAGMNVAQQAVLRLLKEFPQLRSMACS